MESNGTERDSRVLLPVPLVGGVHYYSSTGPQFIESPRERVDSASLSNRLIQQHQFTVR